MGEINEISRILRLEYRTDRVGKTPRDAEGQPGTKKHDLPPKGDEVILHHDAEESEPPPPARHIPEKEDGLDISA